MSGNVTCNVSGVDSVSGILDFQKDRRSSYVFFSSKKKIYKAMREKGGRNRLRMILASQDGMGVVEVILIIVVLIGLVIIFQTNIKGVVASIFSTIQKNAGSVR